MSALQAEPLRFMPMKPSDLDAVVAAEASLYDFPWTRANFSDSLDAGYSAWVVRHGEELVAYAVMMLVLDEAHLLNISVQRGWQQRGYGRALLTHLFDVARSAGAERMFLEVRPSNVAGRALYQHCGFLKVGVRRNYYPAAGGREDAIVMIVEL